MTDITQKQPKSPAVKSTSFFERSMWIFNTLFHQLVAVAGIFILWTLFYNYENRLSRWHMILTATAYLPLMAEAIVLFAGDNVWTQNIKRTTKYYIHGAFMFTSAVLATVGIGFMISVHSAPHFHSIHAWTGLVSWIFVLLSQFLGVASAKAYHLKSILRPVWFKFAHNLFGLLGYLFGLTSLCYGLRKRTFRENTTYESQVATTVVIAVVGAWSIIAALRSGYNQLKNVIT
ncbi:cytochrome b561 domain-containing protein 1 [Asbolus verrucosus]|uniref:ascorbate ferrireductase (transmembrane) n=1 Tax=Asbolus verrucosus TaxID=1661398 RepID=A0A482VQ56_ASBVE|nr:cytochrome b561 domain-containing protein 1 [Asbolus verrucosus]